MPADIHLDEIDKRILENQEDVEQYKQFIPDKLWTVSNIGK